MQWFVYRNEWNVIMVIVLVMFVIIVIGFVVGFGEFCGQVVEMNCNFEVLKIDVLGWCEVYV